MMGLKYTILHKLPMWPTYKHQYIVIKVGTLSGELARFEYERDAKEYIKPVTFHNNKTVDTPVEQYIVINTETAFATWCCKGS